MRIKGKLMIVAWVALVGGFCASVGPVARAGDSQKASCPYGISPKKAASILGISPGDLRVQAVKQMVSPDDIKNKTYQIAPCHYSYSAKSSFLKRFSYVVYVYNDPHRARGDFERMKGHFSAAAKVVMLPGLGEAAFYVRDPRFPRLVAVKGTLLVDVMNPKEVSLRKRVAALVLGK